MRHLLITIVMLTGSVAVAADTKKPNVVVIVSDDCGFNEFSLHGSKLFPTPNIDSIATNGVHCKIGYTSGAVCSPTRAGLLTGRYQQRFGHELNIPAAMSKTNGLPLSETTIANVMKDNGYRTIALGKWHLGYDPKFHPMERGFSDYYGFLQGSRSYFPLEKPTKLEQMLRNREPVKETFEYMTDELAKEAAAYIVKHREKPFFMYLAFSATHSPNHALESDLKQVSDRQGNVKHRAMAIALDRAVGVVLKELDTQKLAENTLVVFLNDNGGAIGHDNAPLRGLKGSTWEGGTRIPFAMRWPDVIPKGKVFEHPVMTIDIMPTAMAAAGIATNLKTPLDGVDLLPYVKGDKTERPHQTLYWKHGPSWAIRDGDLKLLVADKSMTEPELYDLAADPSEKTNLAKERADKVKQLQAEWDDWQSKNVKPLWRYGNE
jgi:arylsulfatase A-like enzyme